MKNEIAIRITNEIFENIKNGAVRETGYEINEQYDLFVDEYDEFLQLELIYSDSTEIIRTDDCKINYDDCYSAVLRLLDYMNS